jgi:NAD(P)-dependent dehydrogenase (short-subunit alcohol dehydrogenase family)
MASAPAALPPHLTGRTAFVAVSGLGIGAALVAGLEAQGARVALVGDDAAGQFASRAAVEAAFAAAAGKAGTPDLVVVAAAPVRALQPAALAGMTLDGFNEASDAGLRATLYAFQAAHAQMKARGGKGGSIVVVGPALSLVGAKQFVPLSTLAEGQRSLVKSAARQWGSAGIRVNWVGVANERYAPELAGKAPEVPELGPPPPALGRAPELAADVAPVLAFLGSDAGRSITGATINLDGGDWMTP